MNLHYRFGAVVLHPAQRELRVDGKPVPLGGRAFDLLVMLAHNANRVVTKEELFDAVWPGLAVEPNNLQVHIWALRKLLGPTAIATVARRGYRLMLEVETGPPPLRAAVDPVVEPLLARLAQCRLLTLTGGDASSRRAIAHAVAQSFIAPHGPWLLDATEAAPDGPTLGRVVREIGASGGLAVLHDAHCAPAAAARLAQALAAHPGARLVLSARAALRLADEVVWPLDAPPTPAGPNHALRWHARHRLRASPAGTAAR